MAKIIKKRNPGREKLLEQMLLPQISKSETIEEMIEKFNAKDLVKGKRLEELGLNCSSLKVRLDKIAGSLNMIENRVLLMV